MRIYARLIGWRSYCGGGIEDSVESVAGVRMCFALLNLVGDWCTMVDHDNGTVSRISGDGYEVFLLVTGAECFVDGFLCRCGIGVS